ncbi:MAG: ribosome small subunit-dependent GTPase A [Bacteroidetes Order II. Incertae sedis bacterium]|nr:ribosome small subunit-dependent GTPase A [Bacteroidetes Order II. bacterium]
MGKATRITGIVLKSTGSWYNVFTAEGMIASRMRGKFRLKDKETTNPIAVGDQVDLQIEVDGSGTIMFIHPRWSKLSRRAAGRKATIEHVIVANVDMAWCVQSVIFPKFNPGFIDRFLVMTEINELPAGILLNKCDLLDEELATEMAWWKQTYEDLGYPVILTSSSTGEGLEALRIALQNKTSVMSGPSGVGKSSLLNVLEPNLGLRTGEMSDYTQKGKHTTTHAELWPLSDGGYVADTPGLREFGIWDLSPEDLSGFFLEFRPFLDDCYYPNCTHDHEPNCAIIQAVNDGHITPERYKSYLNILATLKQGLKDTGR